MTARLTSERGMTLIETAIASALLLVLMAGLLSVASLATKYTENHGHLEARTTEYSQDKMEQLLALAYTDAVSDTTTLPTATSGGTGLAPGGGLNTAAPVNGYVDWLAYDGSLLGGGTTAPQNWYYERVWQITSPSAGLKQISVTTTVVTTLAREMAPKSTVVTLKSSQF
jgi:type II secretory pathway pseudopilin PulG